VVNGKANEYTISGELAGILIDLKKAIEGAYTADENNTVNSYRSCGNVHEDTIFYLSHGKRIAAVKNYRIITGAELKPAVKYVDSVQKEMNQANIITK
jgi:ribosomal protein L7/L12